MRGKQTEKSRPPQKVCGFSLNAKPAFAGGKA